MQLVDYKVRVINARAGTAARVRVVIESKDDDSVWGTVGVSENVIEASWLALVDAFEHKLGKDAREHSGPVARLVGRSRTSTRHSASLLSASQDYGSTRA